MLQQNPLDMPNNFYRAFGRSGLGTVRPLRLAEDLASRDESWRASENRPSPAPLVHAATKKARLELVLGYRLFVAQFLRAADRLRNGDREAKFPDGSFPPGLPFVMPRMIFDPG